MISKGTHSHRQTAVLRITDNSSFWLKIDFFGENKIFNKEFQFQWNTKKIIYDTCKWQLHAICNCFNTNIMDYRNLVLWCLPKTNMFLCSEQGYLVRCNDLLPFTQKYDKQILSCWINQKNYLKSTISNSHQRRSFSDNYFSLSNEANGNCS